MKRITNTGATAAMALSALVAAVGLAGPAQAASTTVMPREGIVAYGIPSHLDHHDWVDNIGQSGPRAQAPHVDTSVHTQGRGAPDRPSTRS